MRGVICTRNRALEGSHGEAPVDDGVMHFAFFIYFGAVLCDGLCAKIMRRERNSRWLTELAQ